MQIAAPPPSLATASALRGLQRAADGAADAAGRIAAFGAAPAPPADAMAGSAFEAAAGDPGLAVVDLLLARRAYEANAAVLRGADETSRDRFRATA